MFTIDMALVPLMASNELVQQIYVLMPTPQFGVGIKEKYSLSVRQSPKIVDALTPYELNPIRI